MISVVSALLTQLLMIRGQDGSIFSNVFIGSYMAIFACDFVTGGILKYIVINLYRRATIPEFTGAVIDPPMQLVGNVI